MLAEAFTPEFGRVGLVARGVRGKRSRARGAIQPFRSLLLSWSGGGELYTLTGTEEVATFALRAGKALASGFYLNELLLRLTQRNDNQARLFASYSEVLHRLEAGEAPEPVLRVFEKRLLEELGYGLLLERTAGEGEPIAADRLYRYLVEDGPLPDMGAGGAGVAVHGASLLALAREELLDPRVLEETKRLMRSILAHYLGPRPLKSRELLGGA
ncbi:MAG: DNA repair protein RecO [Gammaproteobacteria bacterium]|nr:DNA repair protein RecO [Gammaproteobacteria bacterium]NIR32869.1 DNA repair protein RecO [Gammaproteobacteria bacterium]NIR99415.1 DNA repair protein RecO [Gammaproteobacteria bacterium]NIT65029.1 DNA repair protein RecO [Gammaproteobacteria bacterium]NIV21944.1 DNA repair protein RecO [Gammaproteobacteria bacterium]